MKKQLKRLFMAAAMWCIMSLAVYGCESTGESSEEEQTEPPKVVSEEPGQDADQIEPADEASVPDDETGNKAADTSRKNGNEDLIGDIKELSDGQFTVVAAVSEDMENGSSIMVSPGPDGDDSDFDHVTVTYDEDTDIYIRTIYDNGVRYEDKDASAADLSKDAMVLVWGTYGDGQKTIHADQIEIDQFVR